MLKKYVVVGLGFLLVTLPGAVDAWLSLIDRLQGSRASVTVSFGSFRDIYSLVFPLLGLLVLLWGIWWTKPKPDARVSEQPNVPISSAPPKTPLTQEQVAERSAFIRRLRALAASLAQNCQGSEGSSILSLFLALSQETEVRVYILNDGLASQMVSLLEERLKNLSERAGNYKTEVGSLTVPNLNDASVQSICNLTRDLILDYRRSVEEVMKLLAGFKAKGVHPIWESAPYSVRIHREFADNYDELVRLTTDLRTETPEAFQELLPQNHQLNRFPRAFLVS